MIKIKYRNRIYNIDKEKILFVLSRLNSKDEIFDIIQLMKYYKLFCVHFLENINKL